MGSELLKKYTIAKEPFMQTGIYNLWSVYRARNNITKNKVCIFLIERKTFHKKVPKESDRQIIKNILKNDINNLMKISQKNYIKVIEPYKEDKKYIYYITESFERSLSTYIEKQTLSKLEIKEIVSYLIGATTYLNKTLNLYHCSLNIHEIYINEIEEIKIGGLYFCQKEGIFENTAFLEKNIPTQ